MMKDNKEVSSSIQLKDEERQPVECWTRQCYGLLQAPKPI